MNLVEKHPGGVDLIIWNGQFAKEVTQTARSFSCDGDLVDLADSCLSLNPHVFRSKFREESAA